MEVLPDAVDAPARKPKQPFLKRGEGTKRRIDAYKHRKQSVAQAQAAPSDQAQHDSNQHKEGDDRRSGKGWDCGGSCSDDGQDDARAPGTGICSHAPQQAEEDLELEEFRALEREIWGGSQQHGQMQQQPLQQQQQQHLDRFQQQTKQDRPLSQQSLLATLSPEAAEAAAIAAYDGCMGEKVEDHGVDLGHNSRCQLTEFHDDTEWVDTEFSFAAGLADELAHSAHMQPHHQQTHIQQKELAVHPTAKLASDMDTADAPSQSYVGAVFAPRGVGGGHRGGSTESRAHQQHTGNRNSGVEDSSVYLTGGLDGLQQQMVAVPLELVKKWQQFEAAQPALQQEKTALRKMRQELETAAARLEQERQAADKQKAAAQASLEAWRSEEARRLARERRVLEQQSKALLKLPSKKEKSALDALQQQLEKDRSDAKAAAARHRLTVERLRCQIKELQDRNAELREEVRWHEAQQLNATAYAAVDARSRKKPPTSSAHSQTDACLVQELSPTTAAAAAATATAVRLEAASKQQPGTAAAREADSLYAALFGDDEDDADFAAAEEEAASAAGCTGGALVVDAAGQHAGRHNRPPAVASTAAAGRHVICGGQQQPCGVPPGAQLGRRVANSVTLRPGSSSSWADSSQQLQQQTQQQAHGQPESWPLAGCEGQHATCNSRTQAGPDVCTQGHDAWDDDNFTFASVAGRRAAVQSVSSGSECAQQRHQQRAGVRATGSSSSSRLESVYMASSPSDEAPDQLLLTCDTTHGQQQRHQHPDTARHVHATGTASGAHCDQAAAAGSAAAYCSSSRRNPAAISAGRQLLQELQHPDGKSEQLFSDGSRVLVFANGTSKTTCADGGTCIRFVNGDVKRQSAHGRVDYYYAEVATWQSTHPFDVEVFYFPTGQVEGHHADGTLDIIFPDGSIKRVMPDGSEQDITAGLLSRAVLQPPPELDRL